MLADAGKQNHPHAILTIQKHPRLAPTPHYFESFSTVLASISLDLDNKWSYFKTHGDPGWESYPTYLPDLVPEVLNVLANVGMKITFFVVGQDAVLEENANAIRWIGEAGHELGNHSFKHEPWLHLYTPQQIEAEIEQTETAIQQLTGQQTIGFRGPGFSSSPTLRQILSERGYQYDASSFPTFLGPIARAYYFFHSRLNSQDMEKRKLLFGSYTQGFQKLRPYRWLDTPTKLIEIPVTTMPWTKVPIHLSYVMFLAQKSSRLARTYFYNAMRWCKVNRVEPSLLLHPLDFWGRDDEQDLDFFPAMQSTTAAKCELAHELLLWMNKKFECVCMRDHATAVSQRLPVA